MHTAFGLGSSMIKRATRWRKMLNEGNLSPEAIKELSEAGLYGEHYRAAKQNVGLGLADQIQAPDQQFKFNRPADAQRVQDAVLKKFGPEALGMKGRNFGVRQLGRGGVDAIAYKLPNGKVLKISNGFDAN